MSESNLSDKPVVFDLEALKTRCLNNLDLVDRVLTKFAIQVSADLGELECAVAAGNTSGAAKMAHRIKGMTASIEARAMSEAAACCERMALAAATEQLPEILDRLHRDRDELLICINQTRSTSAAEIRDSAALQA